MNGPSKIYGRQLLKNLKGWYDIKNVRNFQNSWTDEFDDHIKFYFLFFEISLSKLITENFDACFFNRVKPIASF